MNYGTGGSRAPGAAGTISASLSHLVCRINLLEIAKRGGGANCTFDPDAPSRSKTRIRECNGPSGLS